MKLNRKVEYALIALKHMHEKKPGVLTSAKEMSEAYGCSFDVLSRVMQKLTRAGVLRSVQGAQGGYHIVRDLDTVTMHELHEVILRTMTVAKCLHSGSSERACELKSHCNIISPIEKFNGKIREFFMSFSVADLLESRLASVLEFRNLRVERSSSALERR